MRVLLWDLRRQGHHARWLSYLQAAAPEGIDVIVSPPAGTTNSPLPPGREWRLLKAFVARELPDAVILMSGHGLARRLAVSPLLRRLPWLILDLRCSMAVLAKPSYFSNTSRKTRIGAYVTLAAREIMVRRGNVAFGYLIPWAVEVGSGELRSRSECIPDPMEPLKASDPIDTADGRTVASLIGVLAPRKGLDVLAAAARSAPDLADRYVLRIAGNPAVGYQREAERLVTNMRAAGFKVEATLRQLSTEEFHDALSSTDVVVLPYVSHLGSSGILGAVLETGRHRVVASDYGWLGKAAASAGAILFTDGDASSLGEALRHAPTEAPVGGGVPGFGSIPDFTRVVWRLLPQPPGGTG